MPSFGSAVFILCFLFSITTPFEFRLKRDERLVYPDSDELCIKNETIISELDCYLVNRNITAANVPDVVHPVGRAKRQELEKFAELPESIADTETPTNLTTCMKQTASQDQQLIATIHDWMHNKNCVWVKIKLYYICSGD